MSLGVGVIGAGVVGGGVVETLLNEHELIAQNAGVEVTLKHIAELNQEALRDFDLSGVTVGTDAEALINDPNVDVVCELIGGLEPAKTFIIKALEAGKHVVTANKMLLAMEWESLTEAAVANKVQLQYEAAVAGGIPIIRAIRDGLSANHITGIYGILNGTCNYILTRMTEEGLLFEDALAQAQALGFAETPPDLDISGQDTAHKCQILASLSFGTKVLIDDLYVEGVRNVTQLDVSYAHEMGYLIKLLAIIRRADNEIEARVHPTLVSREMLLAEVREEFNAIYVDTDLTGPTMYYGRGAGRKPTASAVIADIIELARLGDAAIEPPFHYTQHYPVRDIGHMVGRYYLRFTTQDHPGVLGRICTILGEHGVGIGSCFQHEEREDTPAHVVLMTHDTTESSVVEALNEIDPLYFITEPTRVLRVLQ